jgi:tetratricopeptide (TPR) repeat protein
MEISAEILKQLKIIKWLLLLMSLCAFIGSFSVAYCVYSSVQYTNKKTIDSNKSAASTNIESKKLYQPLEGERLDRAIEESSKNVINCAGDYWLRGKEYFQKGEWQLAIDDFNKSEVLSNYKDHENTYSYIKIAKEKLETANKALKDAP